MNAAKIKDNQWSYRHGLIEFYGRGAYGSPRGTSWRWDCCGVGGFVATKKEAKEKIDRLLSQAHAILESEGAVCSEQHLCRHGIND